MSKLKRGTIYKLNGNPVFLYFDKQDGTVVISDTKTFDNTWIVELSELKPMVPGRQGISSKPKPLIEKKKTEKQLLNEFFDKMALKMGFLCMECNEPLHAFNKWAKRCSTAHVFAKADFPTLACNELNIVFLGSDITGGCNCHFNMDNCGAEKRMIMKIYPLLLERFELLKPLMTHKEIYKAMTFLNIKHGEGYKTSKIIFKGIVGIGADGKQYFIADKNQ